ncbi:MAG: hypothetical protein AAGA86_08140, partial [Bacteroidota bacterium]
AATTSQKLDMRGEDINISNIERKVKEGFEEVAEKVKNVDYEKVGNRVKSSGKTFFDTLGDVVLFLFKILAKFIGILLIIIGGSTIIGLFIGMLTVGIADVINIPGINFYRIMDASNLPIWSVSLLIFLAVGIPFFFLLYLGLKILVNNLKSIGNTAKFSLLGLWLISTIMLIVFGIRQAAAHAYSGSVTVKEVLPSETALDSLSIALVSTELLDQQGHMRIENMHLVYDEEGEQLLLSKDVRFTLKQSKDSLIRLHIRKEANGPSYNEARATAEEIQYAYRLEGNRLYLNDYLTTSDENKFKDQEIRATLFLPEGIVINTIKGDDRCWALRAENNRGLRGCDLLDYAWQMGKDGILICLDCPEDLEEDMDDEEKNKIIINGDGVDIDIQDGSDSFEMKINENGVKIRAKENDENKVNINIDSEGNTVKDDFE